MNSFDLTQVVSSPTHVSHNGKETLIDLALISSSSKLKECSIIPPLSNSDHDGIHLALRLQLISLEKSPTDCLLTCTRQSVGLFSREIKCHHSAIDIPLSVSVYGTGF